MFVLFFVCSARSPATLCPNEKQNEARNPAKQRLGRALTENLRQQIPKRPPPPPPGPDLNAVLLDFGASFRFSFWRKGAGQQAEQNEKHNENETTNTVEVGPWGKPLPEGKEGGKMSEETL